jgi:hypothetical protein
MSAGLPVHVRVNDAATGQPTPCRIRFTDAAGRYYAPLGRLTKFAMGDNEDVGGNVCYLGKEYAYIDGQCEILLPAGKVLVEISKGPEYRPVCQEIDYVAGKLALRFTLERWIDLRRKGWYSGDIWAYALTPHGALLEGAAEDLAVVNLLARESSVYGEYWNFNFHTEGEDEPFQTPPPPLHRWQAIENILSFSGQRPALEAPGHLVVVNTYNQHTRLGDLALLNCHRVVFPIRCGDSEAFADWILEDWCDQCHRKGGLVVWHGQCRPSHYKEGLADLIIGKIDALASPFALLEWEDWHRLWNAGVRFAVTAGSAKDSNRWVLGQPRTYARLQDGEEFNYKSWIEAVRAGRTFVTTGALLTLSVNGNPPGTVIRLPSGSQPVQVRAEARSLSPLRCLEIVVNGNVVRSASLASGETTVTLEAEIELAEGGWLAARCVCVTDKACEPFGRLVPGTLAHTSPVYVQVQDRPPWVDADRVQRLLDGLDGNLPGLLADSPFATDRYREHLTTVFQAANNVLRKRLP